MDSKSVTFLASFPSIQTAIKVGDSGMRVQLDIPESEMANAVELLAMRNVVLRVTVEVAEKAIEEAKEEKPKKGITRFSK